METKQSELFKLLNGINVNAYIEEKQGLSYLKWMEAFRILHNYVDAVNYKIIETEEGLQYWDTPLGIIVKTEVSVIYKNEKIIKQFSLPVLDFKNNPMYSTEGKVIRFNKEIDRPVASVFDINTSIQRCYVKTISMLGLGSYIYSGYDKPETDNEVDAKIVDKATKEKQDNNKLWKDFKEKVESEGKTTDDILKENKLTIKDKDKLLVFVKEYMKKD